MIDVSSELIILEKLSPGYNFITCIRKDVELELAE